MNYLAVFIGGGIGSLLRYITTILSDKYMANSVLKRFNLFDLPIGTFISNIFSSLILGLIVGYFLTRQVENTFLRNLLIVGVCGGFSTFSSFAFENYSLLKGNQYELSFLYVFGSILISLIVIFIGILISKNIFSV